MKVCELTDQQLHLIADINPGFLIENCIDWLTVNKTELFLKKRFPTFSGESSLLEVPDDIMEKLQEAEHLVNEAKRGEKLIRYCPACGSMGPIEKDHLTCCPDSDEAEMISKKIAEQASVGFDELM